MHRLITIALIGVLAAAAPAFGQRGTPGNGTSLVEGWYHHFLHREPDRAAWTWIDALQRGQAPEVVLSQFLASPEYYVRAGGTRQSFIDTIYRDVIGRPPTAGEMNFWYPRLAYTPRADMAYALVTYTGPTEPAPSAGYYGPGDEGYTAVPGYYYRRPAYLYGR